MTSLERAKRDLFRKFRFFGALESSYRHVQDRRHRIPRVILYSVVALAFGLAPFYQDALLVPAPDVLPLLLLIELGWALPASLLGIVAALARWDTQNRQYVNTLVVLSLWGSVLALHLLGLLGMIRYPEYMVPVAVLAVAVFGGFRTTRFIVGSTLVLAIDLMMMVMLLPDVVDRLHAAYQISFFWLVAVAGAVLLDFSSRESWLANQFTHALAQIDSLTGLLTRRSFDTWYARVVAQAVRERAHIAIALIDLDHFKTINDIHGHLIGDEVLEQVGAIIRRHGGQRPLDLQARYGGEEFVVVWYGIDSATLHERLEQLHSALSAVAFYGPADDRVHNVTASIGAVRDQPITTNSGPALFAWADELLYRAKHQGRDRVLVVDGGHEQHIRRRNSNAAESNSPLTEPLGV